MDVPGGHIKQLRNAQLQEVICQLKFPTILALGTRDPVDFQEKIRFSLPGYSCQVEKRSDNTQYYKSHTFSSPDGRYRLSITNNFVALSTRRYTNWEEFTHWLDKPLFEFIRLYRPAYFERIGLRYINIFNKQALGLMDYRWSELIAPQYTGMLSLPDIEEGDVVRAGCNSEVALDNNTRVHFQTGISIASRSPNVPLPPEMQNSIQFFTWDQDLYSMGNISSTEASTHMEQLHYHADAFFLGAISDTLYNALQPEYI